MKPQLTAPPTRPSARAARGSTNTARISSRASTALPRRPRNGASEPGLALASTTIRTHTLVLSGELHQRSAYALEAEIERLCGEGVTGITLDLRGLDYIDSIGVAVIAFQCGLCKRRGYDFAVIPGSRFVERALEHAGVSELLPS